MFDEITTEELNTALYDAQSTHDFKNVSPGFYRDAINQAVTAITRQIADGDLPEDPKELRQAIIDQMEDLGITDPEIQNDVATDIGLNVYNDRMDTQNTACYGNDSAFIMEQLETAVRVSINDDNLNDTAQRLIDRMSHALTEGETPLINQVDEGFFADGGEFENIIRKNVDETFSVYGEDIDLESLEQIIDEAREYLEDSVINDLSRTPEFGSGTTPDAFKQAVPMTPQ